MDSRTCIQRKIKRVKIKMAATGTYAPFTKKISWILWIAARESTEKISTKKKED